MNLTSMILDYVKNRRINIYMTIDDKSRRINVVGILHDQ